MQDFLERLDRFEKSLFYRQLDTLDPTRHDCPMSDRPAVGPSMLFNLRQDPRETRDVASERPEVVDRFAGRDPDVRLS
ncbi:MAG: hypothetical protein P8Y91_03845, partial [Desulfuromonadales bacterium]